MQKDYALFLGCTIPARVRSYELSLRALFKEFDLGLVDLEGFACCGFPMEPLDHGTASLLAARNLAIASQARLPICALCSSCTSILRGVVERLTAEEGYRAEVNGRLAGLGLHLDGWVDVHHFVHILYLEIGLEKLKDRVKRDLAALRLSAHYGCHFLKPSDTHGGMDDPEAPSSIEALLGITGATVVDYRLKKECCGGPVLVAHEETALRMAGEKLRELKGLGVDALVVVCPFCGIMYDSNQRKIEGLLGEELGIPVLYLSQVLGLAMGIEEGALGFKMHAVKAKKLLATLG